ncbi:MAG: four helix bundle protein [Bacteroidetes bacterium]|nr:four helix bundle protein [Bacteroidota bacterium]
MGTYKDLDIWKLSIDLTVRIYTLTKSFPKEENYVLTHQIRKSSVSVPSNIAEGAGRKNKKENLHFLNISVGSLTELETQLIIAERLDFCNSTEALLLLGKLKSKLLNYMKYLRKT